MYEDTKFKLLFILKYQTLTKKKPEFISKNKRKGNRDDIFFPAV